MRILKESSAGLVIDIQERLFPHIENHDELLHRTRILLEGLKILDIPVLVTEQYRKGLGPTLGDVQITMETFRPIEKMTFSCCDDSTFFNALEETGRKFILICGIETHVCVLQTAVDLVEKGFQPVVVEDCVGSRKQSDKDIAIRRMAQEGAIVTTSESVLFELARVSGTDSFKAISRLVK